MSQPRTVIVVLGMGSDNKPHAARFVETDIQLAKKAAGLMGLRIGQTQDATALEFIKKLPLGRVFATGKALVPYVKQDVYDRLLTLLQMETSETEAPDADAPTSQGDVPIPLDPWAAIKVGSIVLYGGKHVDDGWWEASVLAIAKDGETLTMRWTGAPKEKPFKAKRHQVGVLRPSPKSA